MSCIVVRLAEVADLEEVGRITVDAYTAGPGAGTPDYVAVLRDAQSRFELALLFVAVCDGVVAATMTLAAAATQHSELARADELEVRYLAVDPAYWGQGIGKVLIATAREVAQSDGKYLVLDVITHNAKARQMYTKLGFVRAPGRDFSPVANVDLLVYEDATSPFYVAQDS